MDLFKMIDGIKAWLNSTTVGIMYRDEKGFCHSLGEATFPTRPIEGDTFYREADGITRLMEITRVLLPTDGEHHIFIEAEGVREESEDRE